MFLAVLTHTHWTSPRDGFLNLLLVLVIRPVPETHPDKLLQLYDVESRVFIRKFVVLYSFQHRPCPSCNTNHIS